MRTYVVDPDIGADDVDAVKTALVSAANGHVVGFAVGDGVHDEVEHRRVHEDDVVDGEVVCLLDTQETGAVTLAVLVVFVSKTFWDYQHVHSSQWRLSDLPCTAPLPVLLNISKSSALRMNNMFPASVPVR